MSEMSRVSMSKWDRSCLSCEVGPVTLPNLWKRKLGKIKWFTRLPDSSVGKESVYSAEDPGFIPGLKISHGEGIGYHLQYSWASLVDQLVKNLPAMQETCVLSLSQGDPLEKGLATHYSILAWSTPWTEEPGVLQSIGSQRVTYY